MSQLQVVFRNIAFKNRNSKNRAAATKRISYRVDIVKNNKSRLNVLKVRFNLTIKDPKLVFDAANIEINRRYLFYFGRVHIRALELCTSSSGDSSEGRSLCASATIRSSKLALGVESNSLNLSKLNAQQSKYEN